MTEDDLRRILRIRRVTVPRGSTRNQLIILIRKSEGDDTGGGYFGLYWQSPPGIQKRIASLSSNFTYKIANNAIKITAQEQKPLPAVGGVLFTKWLVWITRPDLSKTGPCIICEPRHKQRWKPSWYTPVMPAHSGCVCQWDYVWVIE